MGKGLDKYSIGWAIDYYQKFNIYKYIWSRYTDKGHSIDSMLIHE